MPKTEVRSGQIKDGEVKRDDLNTATSGQAVITKLLAGSGITIDSSTGADSGTGDVTISSSGGGGASDFFSGSVQTTDATPTTLLELEVPEEETSSFIATVAARGPSDKNYWITIEGGVRRNTAGNATLVGTVAKVSDTENSAPYLADVIVSGAYLRVQVTGASAETVEWDGKIVYSIPSSQLTNNENRIQYYDYITTWPSGTTTSAPKQTNDITHNVGRPPDKIVVFIDTTEGLWYEHPSVFEYSGGLDLGWDAHVVTGTGLNTDNTTRVRFFTSLYNATVRNSVIRLIWFPTDSISSSPTAGLKTANLGKTSGVAIQEGVEVKTGDTYNGKAVYVKEVDFGALPNATTKTVAHGVSGGMDEILPKGGMMGTNPATNQKFKLDYTNNTNNYLYYNIDADNGGLITVVTNSNWSTTTAKVIIYYTKP
jgi:hypothetical protein